MTGNPGSILAIDLGTSSVKALVVGTDGSVVASGQASYPTHSPLAGQAEQEVAGWTRAVGISVRDAIANAGEVTIAAIAVTGQMHGTVLLDHDLQPFQPAVTWLDQRSADLVSHINRELGPSLPGIIGGQIATGYLASTVVWFQRERPDIWARVCRLALPVDAIVHWLCGNLATDPSNAVSTGLLDGATRAWHEGISAKLGIPGDMLPEIVPAGSAVGELTIASATALGLPPGIPVTTAGGDALAAAIGGGVTMGDSRMVMLSSGAQVMQPTGSWDPDPDGRWHTWPSALPDSADGARWITVGALLNGGTAIEWLRRTMAPDMSTGQLIELARGAPPGSDGLLFIPHLDGERTPLLDPLARGSFIGLGSRHGLPHLVRATIEGVCLAIADACDRMCAEPQASKEIILGGGGASPLVQEVLASVLGARLMVPASRNLSAVGAAHVTAIAMGWRTTEQVREIVRRDATFVDPDKCDHIRYAARLRDYRAAVETVLPIAHRLQERP